MNRLLIVIALLFAHGAQAGDFEDGVAAYWRKDYATALTKFRSAAKQGNANAQAFAGQMYEYGRGVSQDYKEAVRFYRLAAQQGDAEAQHTLGTMYATGKGEAQDYARAHMWFNTAAINGEVAGVSRDLMEGKMSTQQVERAQRMARECMASNHTKCD